MPVQVVHALEVVAVEKEQREVAFLRLREPVDLPLKLPVEVAVVVEGRERVAARDFPRAALVEEILEREGDISPNSSMSRSSRGVNAGSPWLFRRISEPQT